MRYVLLAALCSISLFACSPVGESLAPQSEATAGATYKKLQPDELLASTLPEIAAALKAGDISAEALVQRYLDRIAAIDRAGPTLQSVLTLNPNALDEARALDAGLAAGKAPGPLHGVPILLKDNIESSDPMPTTAGALALADNVTGRDSPSVAGLRAAGAIILGKTNLSQWANFRSDASISGWSALGGHVRNPHMLDRSPCGSSSGSAVATAASLATGTVGTETNGSIICPSNVNGIVGFKPTVGLVSQQYIVPISFSQDTAGPMTKTVTGAAMMLNAMATGDTVTDYVAALHANSLSGARVGVLRFAQGTNKDIIGRFDAAVAELEAAGAVIVEIEEFASRDAKYREAAHDVLYYEFKATINEYLANAAPAVTTRTLDELIAFNKRHAKRELALFDQNIFEDAAILGGLDDPIYREAREHVLSVTGERGIDAMLEQYEVDVLFAPSGPVSSRVDPINGDVWPNWAGAGWIAAAAGYPNITVPMGTAHGIPIGVSFMGTKGTDAEVLSYGFAYEQRSRLRPEPQYLRDAEDRPEIARAMQRPVEDPAGSQDAPGG